MNLAKTLKHLMHLKEVRLTHLSKAVNVPASTLSNWLNDVSPKDLKQVKRVADYFEITVDELVFGPLQSRKKEKLPIPLEGYLTNEEFYAGHFEVILRRIKK